jgi:hypothetical protein
MVRKLLPVAAVLCASFVGSASAESRPAVTSRPASDGDLTSESAARIEVALAAASSPVRPGYVIERKVSRRIRAVYEAEISVANKVPEEWQITTALAPELPSQTGVRTELTPRGKVIRERGGERRLLLASRFASSELTQSFAIRYEATLWTRRLVPLAAGASAPPAPALGEADRKLYTGTTHSFDYEADAFQKWLDRNRLRRGRSEDEIAVGRRVFAVIVSQYATSQDTIKGQPVSVYCGWTEGDCKVRASVFTAAMRANGIPARMLIGILAKSVSPDATGHVTGHSRAEFFAAGVGWVPADVSYAIGVRDPMTRFGEDNWEMIVQVVDPDVQVPDIDGVIQHPYGLTEPSITERGKGQGTLHYRAKGWDIETLPVSAREAAAVSPQQVGEVAEPEVRSEAPSGLQTSRINMNLTPLETGRFEITVESQENGRAVWSHSFEGTRDEIGEWIGTLTELPAEKKESLRATVEHAGQARNAPRLGPGQRPAPRLGSGGFGMRNTLRLESLGEGRFRAVANYRTIGGEQQSQTSEGTPDEIRTWLEGLPEMSSFDLHWLERQLEMQARSRSAPRPSAEP